jgi:osmotically-inducible protein OsmY
MRAALICLLASVAFAAVPKATPPTDTFIENSIRARFAKSKINEDHFHVSVKSGVATLEGKTDIPQRKGVATRLAKSGGAREVINKIQIGEAARKKLTDRLQKARDAKPKPKTAQSVPPIAVKTPVSSVTAATAPSAPPALRRMEIKH